MNEKITVIIPIYKVEKYLQKCVDSVLAQTYQNLEIILVDDGSPDGCGAVCDDYAKKDARIRVIHKKNGGLSDARNAGLDIMTGDYVAFVDSDDWIEPQMYAELLSDLHRFGAQMALGGVVNDIDDGLEIHPGDITRYSDGAHPFAEDKITAMKRFFNGPWAAWDKLCEAGLFNGIRFPVGEINEDEAIAVLLLDKCRQVCYNNKVFYHYMKRANGGSITATGFHEKKLAWCAHCKANLEYVAQKYPDIAPFAKRKYWVSVLWALNNMTENPRKYKKSVQKYRRELRKNRRDSLWKQTFDTTEKIRGFLYAYFYHLTALALRICGKKYT